MPIYVKPYWNLKSLLRNIVFSSMTIYVKPYWNLKLYRNGKKRNNIRFM